MSKMNDVLHMDVALFWVDIPAEPQKTDFLAFLKLNLKEERGVDVKIVYKDLQDSRGNFLST
jgi:hypothetical protein